MIGQPAAAAQHGFCDHKLRLLVEYQTATEAYSRAVGLLARMWLSGPEYERLRKVTEEAKLASLDARDQLECHIAEHGC